jgi:acidic leucine-rich nuclear phosphoprotein 32 family protein B
MNLYKELQEKLSEHKPTDVDELILDDLFENVKSFTEENKKDLEKYTNLLHLSLNGFGLESLKNFPKIPTLQVLEIRSNGLNGTDFAKLKELYPELYKLKVGENPIKDINVFKCLNGSNITKLELRETQVADIKDYRNTLFSMIPGLDSIDGITKEGEEASSTVYEDDEGEMGESGDEDEFDGEDDEDEFDEYEDDEGDNDDESEH